jgi:hypothetical protein
MNYFGNNGRKDDEKDLENTLGFKKLYPSFTFLS